MRVSGLRDQDIWSICRWDAGGNVVIRKAFRMPQIDFSSQPAFPAEVYSALTQLTVVLLDGSGP